MSSSGQGYQGQAGVSTSAALFSTIRFLVKQMLANDVQTAMPVQVVDVHNPGIGPVGTVDVLPLVNLIDGVGTASEHGTVFGLPYFRLQGGKNAVVCDPKKGDVGLAVIASRDVTLVKKNKAQSNPGSRRKFSYSDGFYLGGFLNGEPDQYVYFTDDGITITDKNDNTIVTNADGITIDDANGNSIVMDSSGIKINDVLFDSSQNVSNAAEVSLQSGVTLNTHIHGGVTTGLGDTGGPSG